MGINEVGFFGLVYKRVEDNQDVRGDTYHVAVWDYCVLKCLTDLVGREQAGQEADHWCVNVCGVAFHSFCIVYLMQRCTALFASPQSKGLPDQQ